jgi:hypothetical protein
MNKFIAKVLSRAIFFLAVCVTVQSARAHDDAYSEVFGGWKIVDLVGGADIVALSDRQARALIGKPFFVSAERFTFNGKTCSRPGYNRRIAEPAKYFREEWHASSSDLPVPNPVTIIENKCFDLFLARKGHLIIAVNGVFFEAVRAGKRKVTRK